MPKYRDTLKKVSQTPIPELGEGHVLTTEVFYSKGGTSMLSGNYEGRGYWVSVRPEKIENGMRSFMMFEGGKLFLQSAKAFSAKTLAALVPDPAKVAALQAKVLAEKLAKEMKDSAEANLPPYDTLKGSALIEADCALDSIGTCTFHHVNHLEA